MDRLTERRQILQRVLQTLDDVIQTHTQISNDHPFYSIARDALIQRYEYSVDVFWKYLRHYLVQKHGVQVPGSPKGIFKSALELSIISAEEHAVLVKMIEDRNLTSHTYDLALAETLQQAIPNYYQALMQILSRLS